MFLGNFLRVKIIKFFCFLVLCGGAFSFVWGDSIPFADLRKKIARDPVTSLALLDSIETVSSYPQYGIDYLRALAYCTQSKYYMAMHYASHALNNPQIRQDSVLTSYAYMLLAESSVASFQLAEAANVITEGKKYAEKSGDQLLKANMLQMEGELYRKMGILHKSYDCIKEAIALLSGVPESDAGFLLSHCMGYLMAYYINDRNPKDAWEIGLQREELLSRLASRKDVDTHMLDRHKAFFYSKMAYLSCKLENCKVGKTYADKFYSTNFSSTFMGQLEINDYLLESKDYHSVLLHSKIYFSKMDKADSLSVIYLRTLYQSAQAYNSLGKHKEAYNAMLRLYDIQSQIRVNIERNQMLDLTDVTKAVSREYELEKASYRMKIQRYVIEGLVGVMIFLLFLFGGLWRALLVIKRKNRKMAELILELDDQRNNGLSRYAMREAAGNRKVCTEEVGTSADLVVSEKEGLFLKFDQKVKEQKLYLDYQLTRDDYARLMGVDRSRFASILKLSTSGGNLSVYLNDLRLEYSVGLFRNHPDWPISKVAAESALPSLSTFYRLFKDKYGISPNSFRKTLV